MSRKRTCPICKTAQPRDEFKQCPECYDEHCNNCRDDATFMCADCLKDKGITLNKSQGDISEVETKWVFNGTSFHSVTGSFNDDLPPGFYSASADMMGTWHFFPRPVNEEKVIEFPDTPSDDVIKEVMHFKNSRAKYREFGLTYKRGILMYGPQGTGKSSILRLVLRELVKDGSYAITFTEPGNFKGAYSAFRKRYPNKFVLCVMEDFDSILDHCCESDVLEILDGVARVDNIVFLATTNYPHKLGPRIINRPSRFDRRFCIGLPIEESRKIYLDDMFSRAPKVDFDTEEWAKKTEGLTLAHLKELFISVVINDLTPEATMEIIESMRETIDEDEYLDPIEKARRQLKRALAANR